MPKDMPTALRETGLYLHRAHEAPPLQYQVLGERGCGTNLVRKLIERSWRIERVDTLMWKHAFPNMLAIPPRLILVCCQREAFSWATSLYKRPWHGSEAMQRMGFSDFLRSPWDSIVDKISHFDNVPEGLDLLGGTLQYDRHPITGEAFVNIFAMRNAKSASLLGLRNRGCDVMYVQMEAVQRDPEAFANAFGQMLGLTPTKRGYREITRRLGNRFPPKVENRPEAPSAWSDADRRFVLEQLDMQLEAAWGYSYSK